MLSITERLRAPGAADGSLVWLAWAGHGAAPARARAVPPVPARVMPGGRACRACWDRRVIRGRRFPPGTESAGSGTAEGNVLAYGYLVPP